MKMQLYVVLGRDADCPAFHIPCWHVTAVSDDYDRIRVQYAAIKEGSRVLLMWNFCNGIEILRINHNEFQFAESLNDLQLPWRCLAATERAGILPVFHQAVLDFLKDT